MTRINVVPPEELSRLHLVAEYRELPRAFALVRAKQMKGITPADLQLPSDYVLGAGHVLFFYDKCLFLLHRQKSLIAEMQARGYDPKFLRPDDLVVGLSDHWMGGYRPTAEALALNRARIKERNG